MTLTTDKDYKEAYVGKIISDEPARVVNQGRSIDKGEVECEEWNDTFTFHSLKPAKALIKANLDKYKNSCIIKTWANGDWENLGEINIKGANKTYVANTRQVKANY